MWASIISSCPFTHTHFFNKHSIGEETEGRALRGGCRNYSQSLHPTGNLQTYRHWALQEWNGFQSLHWDPHYIPTPISLIFKTKSRSTHTKEKEKGLRQNINTVISGFRILYPDPQKRNSIPEIYKHAANQPQQHQCKHGLLISSPYLYLQTWKQNNYWITRPPNPEAD